jgi:chemotaxis protein methyltransferase CheR
MSGSDRTYSPERDIAAIANFVWAQTGIVFPPDRLRNLESVAHRLMARSKHASPPLFLERLRADTALLDELVACITVGETYFFREPAHFAHLRDEIVPRLLNLRGADHTLRAWSAGCATGEEPYSLAILLEELGLAKQASILATDISCAALTAARAGIYGTWSLRNEGARLAGPYLGRAGHRLQIAERFRQRVTIAHLNLAEDVYPRFSTGIWGMDVILCRNVLIYFDADTVRSVAKRLFASLAEGGYLIIGPSDPLLSAHAPFETLTTAAGLIYRKPPGTARPAAVAEPSAAASIAITSPELALAPFSVPEISAQPVVQACDPVEDAREAFARGDHARVVALTHSRLADSRAAALCLRALANMGNGQSAMAKAAQAVERHPTSTELAYLSAIILLGLAHYRDAERALKRVIFLDRELAIAHFTLGMTQHRLGDRTGAARAFRNARELAAQLPVDEPLPLCEGESAGRLAAAAAAQMAQLEASDGIVR